MKLFIEIGETVGKEDTVEALMAHGTAVSWESLDEDLSVRGFIEQAALEETLYHLVKVS